MGDGVELGVGRAALQRGAVGLPRGWVPMSSMKTKSSVWLYSEMFLREEVALGEKGVGLLRLLFA